MWRVSACFYIFLWNLSFAPHTFRAVSTLLVGATHFAYDLHRRVRLMRIEHALNDFWTLWYIPFGAFVVLFSMLRVFFMWMCVHAVSAEGLWPYTSDARRVDLGLGLVLFASCHVLLQLVWKSFFQYKSTLREVVYG